MPEVNKKKIRVRIAPSPTGNLHIGTVRTALFNWLFARHHNGKFIVRIENTDLERSSKEYENDILEGFKWLDLESDEFYRQSERIAIYTKYIQKLLDNGKAFWCYHTLEELEKERQEQLKGKNIPRHVCEFKKRGAGDKEHNGEKIIRLAVNENSTRKIVFEDIIKGKIEFEERLLGDISIAKDEKTPLYNFAVVIDDHEMKISHVIRGEDHIANTPKQILFQEALGFESPAFAHLPLILGPDRSKLSKRHGAESVDEYRQLGYLTDALINFLSLLGWTPETDREILTKNEIVEQFELKKVHKSGAVFDIKKLNWINSQYIKMENDEGIYKLTEPFVEKYFGRQDKELILKLAPLFRERLEYLDQVKEFHYFFKQPNYEPSLLIWKKSDQEKTKNSLKLIKTMLEQTANINETLLREKLNEIAQNKFGGDRGKVYWPLRVALSGEKFSADPIVITLILGSEKALARISLAIEKV